MPITPTYPGVYIEEIPSGVRTITGVATSITAFIGRTRRGPVNEPVTINNFGDFERIFGGLWRESTVSYAVRDFYLNGGSQAIIVRLFSPTFADEPARLAALAAATGEAQTAADAVSAAAAAAVAGAVTAAAQEVVDAAQAAADLAAGTPEETPAQDVVDAVAAAVAGATTLQDVADAAVATGAPGSAEEAATQAVVDAANAAVAGAVATAGQAVADAAAGAVAAAGAPGDAAMAAAQAVADAAADAVAGATVTQDVADAAAAAVPAAVADAAAAQAPVTRAQLSVDTLDLEAANPGTWGNDLRARIDHDVVGPDAANLFNLSVRDGTTGTVENHRNVSVVPDHRRNVLNVLAQESKLVRTFGALPAARPAPSAPAPIGVVPAGGDPFDTTNSSGVTTLASDGMELADADYTGSVTTKTGINALENADLFNLLCIPPYAPGVDVTRSIWDTAASYCESRRAFLLVDPPSSWINKDAARGDGSTTGVAVLGANSANAAVYFPRLRQPNPLRENQVETFVPCGAVAGVMARTDGQRGVWKAPAGLDAGLTGVPQLSVPLTDAENGELNPLGINCLRNKPAVANVVWGARTREGDDRLASEWKYVPVRRLALFIEESLYRGTQWVVFEPNDEPLWAQIRLNLGAFMNTLFRQGAFQGTTPRQAYFVKCDRETTTQNDIDLGIVNIVVGFAPLKPAEFVIIKLQQIAGQVQT